MATERQKFTSVEELLLKTPLYEEVAFEKREAVVSAVLTFDGALDTYCPGCTRDATFRGVVTEETKRQNLVEKASGSVHISTRGYRHFSWPMTNFSKLLRCTRGSHHIMYFFICEETYIVKIGQYPSLADIEKGETDKYTPVLGRERLKEFNRAIGLSAHGVGIGAYVYLRRIFESLVEEAHRAASAESGWDEGTYQQSRMAERITMVRTHLPQFLVQHPKLYSVLSKHLHELSEQECLANFDAVKLAIEVIIDEKLKQRDEAKKIEGARKAMARIDGKLT